MTPFESINKLSELLTEYSISHVIVRKYDKNSTVAGEPFYINQIKIDDIISVICQPGSMGFEKSFLELWDYGKMFKEPIGFLRVEDACNLIEAYLRGESMKNG